MTEGRGGRKKKRELETRPTAAEQYFGPDLKWRELALKLGKSEAEEEENIAFSQRDHEQHAKFQLVPRRHTRDGGRPSAHHRRPYLEKKQEQIENDEALEVDRRA